MELQFTVFRPIGRKAITLLNRPPLNILNTEMCQELLDVLGYLELHRSEYDGLLITTEGKHFCAGADIGEHLPGKVETMLPAFNKLCSTLAQFALSTVAAVKGACMGGGLELARSCQHVIAWDPATLKLSLPEITLACFPPFALATFPRLPIPRESLVRLIRFMLTGEVLKGAEVSQLRQAESIKLIDEVFSGNFEDLCDYVDFQRFANEPSVDDWCSNQTDLNDQTIKEALAGADIAQLNPEILQIAIDVLIGCTNHATLAEILNLAEQAYLTRIVPHPAYQQALADFLRPKQ